MSDEAGREPARDPQDLERMLVSRERIGDVDGMTAPYEPHGVIDCGEGRSVVGRQAIRAFYAGLVAAGRRFEFGEQRAAINSGIWHSLQRVVPTAAGMLAGDNGVN